METAPDNALAEYLRDQESHGVRHAQVAEQLGVKPPALSKWKHKRVPAERVLDVERVTGVPRWMLRPDIYPREAAE